MVVSYNEMIVQGLNVPVKIFKEIFRFISYISKNPKKNASLHIGGLTTYFLTDPVYPTLFY